MKIDYNKSNSNDNKSFIWARIRSKMISISIYPCLYLFLDLQLYLDTELQKATYSSGQLYEVDTIINLIEYDTTEIQRG